MSATDEISYCKQIEYHGSKLLVVQRMHPETKSPWTVVCGKITQVDEEGFPEKTEPLPSEEHTPDLEAVLRLNDFKGVVVFNPEPKNLTELQELYGYRHSA